MNTERKGFKMEWNGNLCAYCGRKVFSSDKLAMCCDMCRLHQNG